MGLRREQSSVSSALPMNIPLLLALHWPFIEGSCSSVDGRGRDIIVPGSDIIESILAQETIIDLMSKPVNERTGTSNANYIFYSVVRTEPSCLAIKRDNLQSENNISGRQQKKQN